MKLGLGAGAAGTGAESAAGVASAKLRDSLALASNRLTWAALVSLKTAAEFSAVRPAEEALLACCAQTALAATKMIAIPKIGLFIPIFLRLSYQHPHGAAALISQ